MFKGKYDSDMFVSYPKFTRKLMDCLGCDTKFMTTPEYRLCGHCLKLRREQELRDQGHPSYLRHGKESK